MNINKQPLEILKESLKTVKLRWTVINQFDFNNYDDFISKY